MTKSQSAELAFLFRTLKAPAAARALPKLAERARQEEWSYERFAEALLATEVASRDAHGGEARIKQARFPARKTLEEFDFSFQRSVQKTLAEILSLKGDSYRLRDRDLGGRPPRQSPKRPDPPVAPAARGPADAFSARRSQPVKHEIGPDLSDQPPRRISSRRLPTVREALRAAPATGLRLVTDSFCRDHSPTLVPASDWNLGNQHLRLGAKGLSLHRNDCVNQALCQLTVVP
jgi:hypothetical protein